MSLPISLVVVAILVAVIVTLLVRQSRRTRAERAHRESEERFRLTIDRSPALLWSARPDTTLDYLNGTCQVFTGLPIEKLRDEGWWAVVHPDDLDRIVGVYGPAIEARKHFTLEYRMRRADGAWRSVLAPGVPRYEADGSYSGYTGCVIDITERKEAEELMQQSRVALEASHQEVQQLAGRLITAHEDERRRLARELHDDLTQRLARLAIDAGRLERTAGMDSGATAIRQELVRLSEDVHALSYRLHPSVLDDLGLVEALRAECDRVARHSDLRVDVQTRDVPDALSNDTSLCIFRVAQEALGNAVRHAQAHAVNVSLAPNGKGLQLVVSDDGSGFDAEASRQHASLGLASMRERVRLLGGGLNIDSSPGRGTKVVAWVPA